MQTENKDTPKYKFVFVGDQGVGKTSIITRFVDDEFAANYEATIGVDFLTKSVFKNDMRVKLHLWDTAGQERFKSLIPSYIRKAHCICFVYDVTHPLTLQNIGFWWQKVSEYCRNFETVQMTLIGNKIDNQREQRVSPEEAQELAKQLNIPHVMQVSAKSGENIDQLFEEMVSRLPEIRLHVASKLDDTVELDNEQKSGCFCQII